MNRHQIILAASCAATLALGAGFLVLGEKVEETTRAIRAINAADAVLLSRLDSELGRWIGLAGSFVSGDPSVVVDDVLVAGDVLWNRMSVLEHGIQAQSVQSLVDVVPTSAALKAFLEEAEGAFSDGLTAAQPGSAAASLGATSVLRQPTDGMERIWRLLADAEALRKMVNSANMAVVQKRAIAATEQGDGLDRLTTLIGIVLAAYAISATMLLAVLIVEMRRARGAEGDAHLSGDRFRQFAEMGSDWIWETDAELRLTFLSAPRRSTQGVARSPVGQPFEAFAAPARDRATGALTLGDLTAWHSGFKDVLFTHADAATGKTLLLRTSAEPVLDGAGRFVGLRGISTDVTRLVEDERRIRHLAEHDSLTGLGNRALFYGELRQRLTDSIRAGSRLALLNIDLDGFKEINDIFGHDVGDALLIAVAERMRSCIEPGDLLARLGGDEFAIVYDPARPGAVDPTALAERLVATAGEPFKLCGQLLRIGASVGIAETDTEAAADAGSSAADAIGGGTADGLGAMLDAAACVDGGAGPEELRRIRSKVPRELDGEWGRSRADSVFKAADLALYAAKSAGKNGWCRFDDRMRAAADRKTQLRAHLTHAIQRGELHLHFQPQADLLDGRIVGAEALLRWTSPELGTVTPDEFIPIAEDTGLIRSIGAFVLAEACREAAAWPEPIIVAVNVSPAQLAQGSLADELERVLAATGLAAERLEVELTERLFLGDVEKAEALLGSIDQLGVRLAIDDFGTGYSSLSYIKRFRFDQLKIDRSFIDDLSDDPEDLAIVRAIVSLADALRIETLAEGVQTTQQCRILRDLGCASAQGYLLGRPMPATDFARRLASGELASNATRRCIEAAVDSTGALAEPSDPERSTHALSILGGTPA